ncbi:MAG: FAD-binding protein [Geminicoccaceae bacterium]|nr:MAG: FAD-binding protein [Geminicoccaceae bacterium]
MSDGLAPSADGLRQVLEGLQARFQDRFSTAQALRDQHGKGEAWHASRPPDGVVFCTTTDEVAAVVGLCLTHRVPVVPFGAGSSLEGQLCALKGGISLDLTRMNRILEVNDADLDVRVEAGVTRKQLNAHLRDMGLFFPIDPGADATLGGMAATRASGTNAVRYGTMKENVLGVTAVMPDGNVARFGGRARKSSAGYDLTRLLVGSEGTLGVITELQLKLYGIPEAISAAVCGFPSLEAAVHTVIETIQIGVPVARVELLDEVQMGACIAYSKLQDLEPVPTLFFEFHGSTSSVAEQAEMVESIAGSHGGSAFRWTTNTEERNHLWQARHDVYYAALGLRPGAKAIATDICVPISELAEAILAAQADINASGLIAPIVGHVGDGNFHVQFMVDPDNAEEMAKAEAINGQMVARALAVGGTCTGEHGIGIGKIDKLAKEHATALPYMIAIKRTLDPHGIMNPGKIFRMN